MATRRLSPRKPKVKPDRRDIHSLAAFFRRVPAKSKHASNDAAKDIVAQWRALKRAGIYAAKEKPALKNLTPKRARQIKATFAKMQNVAQFDNGKVYRPFEKQTIETTQRITTGGMVKLRTQKRTRYVLDKQHFQKINKKKLAKGQGYGIKTREGFIIPKSADEKMIVRGGKLKIHNAKLPEIQTTREPIFGDELRTLSQRIRAGKVRQTPGTMYRIYYYGQGSHYEDFLSLSELADKMEHYQQTMTPQAWKHFTDYTELTIIEKRRY